MGNEFSRRDRGHAGVDQPVRDRLRSPCRCELRGELLGAQPDLAVTGQCADIGIGQIGVIGDRGVNDVLQIGVGDLEGGGGDEGEREKVALLTYPWVISGRGGLACGRRG